MKNHVAWPLVAAIVLYFSLSAAAPGQTKAADTFENVVRLVDQHSRLIVLSDAASGASIAVWPAMQGRVLTSSSEGPNGRSFGWINRDLITSGKPQPHINAVGGEDRLWVGPEGGQFSIFFASNAPFDLDHWYTPAPIDTLPFDVVAQTGNSVSFRKEFSLTNYSGTHFQVRVDRVVRLLTAEQSWSALHVSRVPGVKLVGFESHNTMTNLAPTSWNKSTGLLSLWVLGQFNASPSATIILPIHSGSTQEFGIPVTTNYFGPVPADRIAIEPDFVLFKADAQYRSKLGLSQQRSKRTMGSHDAQNHVLTIVQFTQPDHPAEYVNSAWKIQKDPFQGDVANCYNDGPPSPGKPQLGNFYELESSSPAKALVSHASVEHVQRTIHLVGTEQQLNAISLAVLGTPLDKVPFALK